MRLLLVHGQSVTTHMHVKFMLDVYASTALLPKLLLSLLSSALALTMSCLEPCACADTEPFTFTAALQPHFAVHNLTTNAQHVRILGLGGKWIFDYADDPRHPRLDTEKEDYVTFGGDGGSPLAYCVAGGICCTSPCRPAPHFGCTVAN